MAELILEESTVELGAVVSALGSMDAAGLDVEFPALRVGVEETRLDAGAVAMLAHRGAVGS